MSRNVQNMKPVQYAQVAYFVYFLQFLSFKDQTGYIYCYKKSRNLLISLGSSKPNILSMASLIVVLLFQSLLELHTGFSVELSRTYTTLVHKIFEVFIERKPKFLLYGDFFSGKNTILCILKGILPFKMHTIIIIFSENLKKILGFTSKIR